MWSVKKSSVVAERLATEVEGFETSTSRAGTGRRGTVCSGKAYLKLILEGILKAVSSCSTKFHWSEVPKSFSIQIYCSIWLIS